MIMFEPRKLPITVSPCLNLKHKTRLKLLASDEQLSFIVWSVNDEKKSSFDVTSNSDQFSKILFKIVHSKFVFFVKVEIGNWDFILFF